MAYLASAFRSCLTRPILLEGGVRTNHRPVTLTAEVRGLATILQRDKVTRIRPSAAPAVLRGAGAGKGTPCRARFHLAWRHCDSAAGLLMQGRGEVDGQGEGCQSHGQAVGHDQGGWKGQERLIEQQPSPNG